MPANDQIESTHNPLALKEALESMRPSLAAMPPSEVLRAKLDASRASGLVVGSLPRIEKHRAELEAKFGEEATAYLDELPVIANATTQAVIELAAAESGTDVSDRFAQVSQDHELLLADAEALLKRKLLERTRVDAGRPAQGYRTTAMSTLVLIELLRERWEHVKHMTPLTIEELDAMEARAQAMLKMLDEREQGSTRLPAVEMRARALTRLIHTYGEVQRMLTYVRWWDDDADDIAPSLWAGRKRSRAPALEGDPVDPAAPPVASPEGPALPPPVDPNGSGPFAQ